MPNTVSHLRHGRRACWSRLDMLRDTHGLRPTPFSKADTGSRTLNLSLRKLRSTIELCRLVLRYQAAHLFVNRAGMCGPLSSGRSNGRCKYGLCARQYVIGVGVRTG